MSNKNNKNHNVTVSPEFDNCIEPTELLVELHEYIDKFYTKLTNEDFNILLQKIDERLESIEIIAINDPEQHDKLNWLMYPIEMYSVYKSETIPNKIKRLLKINNDNANKGDNEPDFKYIEVKDNVSIPFRFEITNVAKRAILNDELHTTLVHLLGLENIIRKNIDEGIKFFLKPYGINNTNRLKGWLLQEDFDSVANSIHTLNLGKELKKASLSIG